MRILVVSHPPLESELGAGQAALALTEGLREIGVDAVAWSSAGEVLGVRGAGLHRARSRALSDAIQRLGPFDIIDAPAADLVELEPSSGRRVARSVQPVLAYLRVEARWALRHRPFRPSTWRSLFETLSARRWTIRGMLAADRVLALGSLDRETLLNRLPGIAPRVATYFAAPPSSDREALREVRVRRAVRRSAGTSRRYLWMGRWTAHKGIERLLDWAGSIEPAQSESVVTVAGCGEVHDRRLHELSRRGVVDIVPRFDRAELPGLLARHDAGLFTSVVEGWGLGLQEMLESGLPVHAVEAGAVPDLRPWLAPLLLPFPPPGEVGSERTSIDWSAYDSRFSWTQLAKDYLAAVRADEKGRG